MTQKKFGRRGKVRLSDYFNKFDENSSVCIIKDASVRCSFPKRIIGRSGTIVSQRGSSYLVKVNELDKIKTFIVHPIHLKLLGGKKEEVRKKK